MKMKLIKKSLVCSLALCMMLSLTACEKENDNTWVQGVLTKVGVDEETYSEKKIQKINMELMLENISEGIEPIDENGKEMKKEDVEKNDKSYKYFDSLTSLELALEKNKIDSAILSRDTANYLISKGCNVTIDEKYQATNNGRGYAMLLKESDKELCDKITQVIDDMKEDGTLSELEENYIVNFNDENLYSNIEDPEKETITVALTGDVPPVDYINADGTPCGFNVAFLVELEKRLNVNIKTINIDSASRAIALQTGKCDVVFWCTAFDTSKMVLEEINEETKASFEKLKEYFPDIEMSEDMTEFKGSTFDIPNGCITTSIYHEVENVRVLSEKGKEKIEKNIEQKEDAETENSDEELDKFV